MASGEFVSPDISGGAKKGPVEGHTLKKIRRGASASVIAAATVAGALSGCGLEQASLAAIKPSSGPVLQDGVLNLQHAAARLGTGLPVPVAQDEKSVFAISGLVRNVQDGKLYTYRGTAWKPQGKEDTAVTAGHMITGKGTGDLPGPPVCQQTIDMSNKRDGIAPARAPITATQNLFNPSNYRGTVDLATVTINTTARASDQGIEIYGDPTNYEAIPEIGISDTVPLSGKLAYNMSVQPLHKDGEVNDPSLPHYPGLTIFGGVVDTTKKGKTYVITDLHRYSKWGLDHSIDGNSGSPWVTRDGKAWGVTSKIEVMTAAQLEALGGPKLAGVGHNESLDVTIVQDATKPWLDKLKQQGRLRTNIGFYCNS